MDKYLPQYFIKNNTKYNQTQVNQKLDDILKKFKQEVLSVLLQEKDRFRNEVKNNQKYHFKVIELFAGCGGMALGFDNAGLKTELLVEINKNCCQTLEINKPHWHILNQDVTPLDFTTYCNKIDIVAGGFPCQAFSHAGERKGFLDTRGTLFFEFARCIKEVNPKIIIAENVRGLITHQKGETLSIILNTLDELGYHTY